MSPAERERVSDEASAASEIATLAGFLSRALAADPDTSIAAQAVDGIERLALSLTNRLIRLGDPEA